MAVVAFDTLKLADRLQAGGFTAEQARTAAGAFAEAMSGSDLATKADLRSEIGSLRSDMNGELGSLRNEMSSLRSELKAETGSLRNEMGSLRSEMKAETGTLRAEIDKVRSEMKAHAAETKADILKWVLGAMAFQTAFLTAIKFFVH